jgi:hypothetical protein
VSVGIPNTLALVEQQFFNQFFVLDVGVNALDLVFSNGGVGVIGR